MLTKELFYFLRTVKSNLAKFTGLSAIYSLDSFSQHEEDVLISNLFNDKTNGFYVDIGAHHPFRYSNTQKLYAQGWRGINIDPILDVSFFNKVRKRDINLKIAVGEKSKIENFYMFKDSAFNTLAEERGQAVIASKRSQLIKKEKIKTETINNVLDKYVKSTPIDFMNIDVEGLEYEILKSLNFEKYPPKVLAVENIGKDEKKLSNLLKVKGYKLRASTSITSIYEKVA